MEVYEEKYNSFQTFAFTIYVIHFINIYS